MVRGKKGIESVEVWMWLIAGLVIGSLIFLSGYTLLSQWIKSNEINQVHRSYDSLKASIINTCAIGTDMQEIKSYVFPKRVNNITILNESNDALGYGTSLCMDVSEEGLYCERLDKKPNSCYVPLFMKNISFDRKDSLFYIVQKALGKAKASKIEFTITKYGRSNITINWSEVYLK